LSTADYLAAPALDAGKRVGRIYLAARVTAAELRSVLQGHIEWREETAWDDDRKMVCAHSKEYLGRLVLGTVALEEPEPPAVRRAMIEGVQRLGLSCLPWDGRTRDWQARVLSLRVWEPEAGWPDVSDDALLAELEAWLAPYLDGIRKASDLRRLDLMAILTGLLEWPQRQELNELAPTHLQVPSGSRKRLNYRPGEPPVLAVRLQEMFGLRDTPRICHGRVPVILHLLSPAQRPIQVTQDLEGFWERTYGEVKKELKGRYPKHYWPEDPFSAVPSTRPGRPRS
jgi:ATP-dependent helicase HrpB